MAINVAPFSGTVAAKVETVSLAGSGDIADDPTIWINPTDPSRSAVIGTGKDTANGGRTWSETPA